MILSFSILRAVNKRSGASRNRTRLFLFSARFPDFLCTRASSLLLGRMPFSLGRYFIYDYYSVQRYISLIMVYLLMALLECLGLLELLVVLEVLGLLVYLGLHECLPQARQVDT